MHSYSHSLHHIWSKEHSNPISGVSPRSAGVPTHTEVHPWLRPHDSLRTGKAEWRHVIHYWRRRRRAMGRMGRQEWRWGVICGTEDWRKGILLVSDSPLRDCHRQSGDAEAGFGWSRVKRVFISWKGTFLSTKYVYYSRS